jgi:hypothetical protein
MTKIDNEKRKWSTDGQFTLTRLVIYDHSSKEMPESFSVRFNRDVVYQGYDYGEALQTFMMYENVV